MKQASLRPQGKIFILSGPSGSGKTTLYQKLLKDKKIKSRVVRSVSVTTRAPRVGEKDGKDYFFVSKKQFLVQKKTGQFLESMKVFDNYYGTPKKYVNSLLRKGKSVLLAIDVKGAKVVFKKMPQAVGIFIKTPSLKELKKRLADRGSEDKKVLELRFKTAVQELKEARHYRYGIVNDQLSLCYKKLRSIILSEIE